MLLALTSADLLCGTGQARAASKIDQALSAYDAAITADTTPALAKLTSALALNGTAGSRFDFGAGSGDKTMEFILQGDTAATPATGYLAIGSNRNNSLRYKQWQNSNRLGFTRVGIADYLFTPNVPSPTNLTHIAYVWNSSNCSMQLYVNGLLAGTTTHVSTDFAMPTGVGYLGSDQTGTDWSAQSIASRFIPGRYQIPRLRRTPKLLWVESLLSLPPSLPLLPTSFWEHRLS